LTRTVRITVNGALEDVPEGATLDFLIERFRETDPGLVVEHNGRLVFPQQYAAIAVFEGDAVEFIHCGFSG
jgi:thiamine biosynthesis protein ThiS